MDIRISGKNISVTSGMKEHIQERLSKFEKYAPRLVESHVILKKEKIFFVAEITLLAKHLRAYGDAQSKDNIFAAIDMAYARVEKQLKRFREKIKDHHKRETPSPRTVALKILAGGQASSEPFRENEPKIVRSRAFVAAEPLFIEDASQQLMDSAKAFLIFQNAASQQLNVIFKRDDGNHGLVEP